MIETIKEFFSSPQVIALVSSIGTMLIANFGTIMVFAIKYLKLKAKEAKDKAAHAAVIEQLTAAYESKIESFAEHIDESLDKVEKVVIKKVKEQKEVEAEHIEKETMDIKEALEQAKKALED